jgi:CheY-like chemotaxis protein
MSNAYVRETSKKRRPGTRGVLVVDDDPALVRLIRMTLSLGGFDVMSAMNGAEALEAVRAHEPHVILLDV